jgi:DNA polymerase-3 subunit delta
VKIAAARANGFAAKPDPAARAVLLYGPDAGLVRERADRLARGVVEDLSDPFRVGELSAAQIKDDPARLADEAAALALTGGRRVVRVRDATDGLTDPFEHLLSHFVGEALVVVEAGDLDGRSRLRKLFEAADNAAAIACYAEAGADLRRFIQDTLRERGLGASDDAMEFLVEHLGGDRKVTRGELEKLALYMGTEGKRVTLDDAVACVGDSAALALDDVALSAFAGDGETLATALARAGSEAINAVAVLRAAQRHAQRLHQAAALVAGGMSADAAVKSLRPPVFFKSVAAFQQQLRLWGPRRLAQILERLVDAEGRCKTTGMPADAVCGQALTEIALMARAMGRRG